MNQSIANNSNSITQLNSDLVKFSPTLQEGLSAANSNVSIKVVSFLTINKLCLISFEAAITNAYTSDELLKLPSGMQPFGDYHFVFDFEGTSKHAWIKDRNNIIHIQNGASKTGNIRGEALFLLR